MTFIKHIQGLLFAATIAVIYTTASAQSYPTQPIKVIVPYGAGSATDILARRTGASLTSLLGQAVVVDNKAGGSGAIGASFAARAPADGYTLFFGTTQTQSVNPHLLETMSYDPMKDFAPVGIHTWLPYAIVVNANSKLNTYADLRAAAAADPGKLTYASIGNGTTSHLIMLLLQQRTNLKLTHVPYRGSAQAQTDLIGGQVDMTFDTVVSMLPHIKSGKLRPLAVSTLKRSPLLPDVPTLHELGVSNFEVGAWLGLLAPAGTPKYIVDKLNQELNMALDDEAVKTKLTAMGSEILKNSPEEFSAFIRSENERWSKLVRETGAKVD